MGLYSEISPVLTKTYTLGAAGEKHDPGTFPDRRFGIPHVPEFVIPFRVIQRRICVHDGDDGHDGHDGICPASPPGPLFKLLARRATPRAFAPNPTKTLVESKVYPFISRGEMNSGS